MLGPDSRLLTALLIIVSATLLTGGARLRLLPAKIACGALSIMVAMTGGVAAVNDYYGYYPPWGKCGPTSTAAPTTSASSQQLARPRPSGQATSDGLACPASSAATPGAGWCTCRRSTARPSTHGYSSRSSNCSTARPALRVRGSQHCGSSRSLTRSWP